MLQNYFLKKLLKKVSLIILLYLIIKIYYFTFDYSSTVLLAEERLSINQDLEKEKNISCEIKSSKEKRRTLIFDTFITICLFTVFGYDPLAGLTCGIVVSVITEDATDYLEEKAIEWINKKSELRVKNKVN